MDLTKFFEWRSAGAVLSLLAFSMGVRAEPPIQLYPDNPHYLLWRGRPTVLITSGEHYGAVMNLDFDYGRYLAELNRHHFNLTRVFSGSYREVEGTFNIAGNTLAPAVGRYVAPWARSEVPGASDGKNKFDLMKWDPIYFERLKDFVEQASQRGIVVEVVLFCTMYSDALWSASPMNFQNNINEVGNVGRGEVYSGTDRRLVVMQLSLATKIAVELNRFDNVYFEICNEPYERAGLTAQWSEEIAGAIVAAEAHLPNRHMIAQNFPPMLAQLQNVDPRISIFNFHAAQGEVARANLGLNRALAFDETGGSDQLDRKYRVEGWDWMLSGGAIYDNLDFSFTTQQPDGSAIPLPKGMPGGGGPELRRQLSVLKAFMESVPFVQMKPDPTAVRHYQIRPVMNAQAKGGAAVRVMSRPGAAYAAYVHGGTHASLSFTLPAGDYTAEWVNTRTGQIEHSETFTHQTGDRLLSSPEFKDDIALRMIGQKRP